MKSLILITVITSILSASYPELLFNGNCVTCHKTDNLNNSAPTIQEIQTNYKNAFPNKKEFINYMSTWVLNPKEETSIMQDSIKKYGLMPELAYDIDTLREISEYLFEKKFDSQKTKIQ